MFQLDCKARFIHLDAEISDRALDLRVTEQELNGPQVAGASVDQRRFGPRERVCAEQLGVQSDAGDPSGDKPCILARRHALAHAATVREQKFAVLLPRGSQVVIDSLARLVRQLELHRPSRLPLPDGRAIDRVAAGR
jgi:hypothetical protein